MAISAPGVGSNLDVNGIVSQLMALERRPLSLLDQREVAHQAKLSAFGNLKSALASFKSAVATLNNPAKFQAISAVSADATVLTASATGAATIGSYNTQVTQLAQAQALVATGQLDITSAIGTGASTTISFDFGTISGGTLASGTYTGALFTQNAGSGSGTVTIDGTNNTLHGIRDAINSANLGVTASILNDGGASPYRLVLQGANTGAAQSVRISVNGDSALQDLLTYDASGVQKLTQTTVAQDAALTINGVSIASSSNKISNVIDGISFTVLKVGTSAVSVARDGSGVQTALQAFVKSYNELHSTLAGLSSFDAQSRQGGPLLGDATLRNVQAQVRSVLSGGLSSVGGGKLTVLSQVGLSVQKDGTMALDMTKMQAALNESAAEFSSLFASIGKTSDSLVKFFGASDDTEAGTYDVTVSALATQGTVVGSAVAGLIITTGVNDQLTVNVDGAGATVTLTAGTYSAASLASQVQAAINGAGTFTEQNISGSVGETGGVLFITSNQYGSGSSVSVSGSAASALFGGAPTATNGTDVAGTINGAAAVGSRQTLTGSAGNATGLQLEVTGGSPGDRGTVSFSRGYAYRLDRLLDDLLSASGPITGRTEGINRSIKDIGGQREVLNRRLEDIEKRYRAQFTALDTLISNMNSTSNFLTQQLANLPGARNS